MLIILEKLLFLKLKMRKKKIIKPRTSSTVYASTIRSITLFIEDFE